MPTTAPLTSLLKTLGDDTRLRILALIEREELSVGELSRALGMSQSRVSNHLRLLRKAGLLSERRSGTSTFLRLAASLEDGAADSDRAMALDLWTTLRPRVDQGSEHRADLLRLEQVVDERERSSTEFFDRVAEHWDKIGTDFDSGQARHRAAAGLLPRGLVLADLGCGTGYLGRGLVGLASRLICVDRSRAMLSQARRRLAGSASGTELDFRLGELHALPIEDAELDGLVAGMVLHHLAELDSAAREMRRVLKPGGTLSILELAPHHEEWMREAHGDRHLGLAAEEVLGALERAGFAEVRQEPVSDHYQPLRPRAGDDRPSRRGSAATAGERARLDLYLVRARVPS